MLNKMRQRVSDEGGFTLIELLVVILIIGILAAIAIPAFLSQTKKAYSSAAKSLAQTAETAAEEIGTENGGSYSAVTKEELHKFDSSIPTEAQDTSGPESLKGPVIKSVTASATGYTIEVEAQKTGEKFSVIRSETKGIERTCTPTSTACVGNSW